MYPIEQTIKKVYFIGYFKLIILGVKIMSNRLFSKEEIDILSKNKYVENVSEKGITYNNELKKYL